MRPAVSFSSSGQVFRFGQYEADARRSTLMRDGVRIRIQDQPFRVLLLLLEHPYEIVTREELRQALWPEGTHVDFDGSLNVIFKKLRAALDDDSENPRFIETVPRKGYRFIAPVALELGKDNGTTKIGTDQAAVLDAPPSVTAAFNRSSLLIPQVAAACVLVLLIGLVCFQFWRQSIGVPLDASAHVPVRKSVAVLGFHNVTGRADDAWLGTAFSELLRTELAAGDKLRLVSGEEVANLHLASPWPDTDSLDRVTTARIGNALNGDLLVLGSYTTSGRSNGGHLRIDVRLQDARTGEILSEIAQTGEREDLFEVISGVGASLRNKLGIPQLPAAQQASVAGSMPMNHDAARLYALGVAELREFDAVAAKDLLQQACDADPKFPLGHVMLARAWNQLGYEQNRKNEAKRALDLSANLPRTDRMQVEGDYYESLPDHEKAASTYHALFELFGDNVEFGLQLAQAQVASGGTLQALETLHQLRRLPPPASDDPRIDLAEVRATSNKPTELVLVQNAIRKAASQGKKLVYAQGKKEECMVRIYGDQPDLGITACKEAYKIYMAAGNRPGAADALRLIGDRQGALGNFEDSIATYQQAFDAVQGLGEHLKTGAILNNMADAYLAEGKVDRAEQFFRQALANFEQGGEKYNTTVVVGNLADILYLKGKLPEATKMYERALSLGEKLDYVDLTSYAEYRLADLDLARGRVKDAHRLAQQAIDALRPTEGGYQDLIRAMFVLGDALQAQGDVAGARQQYEQGLAICQKKGFMELAAKNQVELAGLALEDDHPSQAEPILRAAIGEFEKEKADLDATRAWISLSRTLLMEGKLEESRSALQQGGERSRTSPDPAIKMDNSIQRARIALARVASSEINPDFLAARGELRSVIDKAKQLGYYQLETEARLVLGEMELKVNPRTGRAQLMALASEARSQGLELCARKADHMLASFAQVASAH